MDNFDLRNFLIENKLTSNSKLLSEQQVEEVNWKGLAAGAAMTLAGITGAQAQLKPEYKAQIDLIQKVQTMSPQQKRVEIQKIVQLNRDEISGKKRQDFLRTMAAAGFTDEESYKKYLAKNAKKPDVGLDGLQIGKCNTRGDRKGSCSTGQTMGGDSLRDVN
jgi:hypothetical protein